MATASHALEPSLLARLQAGGSAQGFDSPGPAASRRLSDLRIRAANWLEERIFTRYLLRLAVLAEDQSALLAELQKLRLANRPWRSPADLPLTRVGELASDAYWLNRGPRSRGLMLFLPATSFIMPVGRKQVGALQAFASRHGISAILMHYPLAPEHPFPAPVEAVAADYRWLLEQQGHRPEEIVICAASAGASVGLGALQMARAAGLPMPAGLLLFSPWVDLTLSGWSYITRGLTTQIPIRMEFVAFCARLYLGEALAIDPLASPLFADLAGFPPIQIHASRRDLYFDDSVRLVARARDAGVAASINYWDKPQHFLEQFRSPEARQSLDLAAEFLLARLGR